MDEYNDVIWPQNNSLERGEFDQAPDFKRLPWI